MVKKMNKKGFVKALQKELNYEEEKCVLINDILENTFLIGKKNKEKMVQEFMTKLNVDEKEANEIYEISMHLLSNELKRKILHPFGSQDKN